MPSFLGCFLLGFARLGSAAVEEVPEIGDEPDGAAGGGEAPAGREREAAEGELGAQQRFLMCSLISFPSVLLSLFSFPALRFWLQIERKDHPKYAEVMHMFRLYALYLVIIDLHFV